MWGDASSTSTAESRTGVVGLAFVSSVCTNKYKFSIVEEFNAFRYIGVDKYLFFFLSNNIF